MSLQQLYSIAMYLFKLPVM